MSKTVKKPAPDQPTKPKGSGRPVPPWATVVVVMLISFAFSKLIAVFAAVKMAMLYSVANNGKFSGRADGNVYMRNGRTRGMKIPALVRNTFTMFVRSTLASLSSAWRGLTEEQREGWQNFEYQNSDRFGNAISVKGKTAYVGLNQNLAMIAVDANQDAPTPAGANAQSAGSIAMDNSDAEITFNDTSTAVSGNWALVSATAPLSTGVSRPSKSAFRIIGFAADLDSYSGATSYADYVAKFGAPPAGSKVFISIRGINSTTGEAVAGVQLSCIVTA